jgi:hypothetical protein
MWNAQNERKPVGTNLLEMVTIVGDLVDRELWTLMIGSVPWCSEAEVLPELSGEPAGASTA